jgi:hypothetical protein
MKNIPYNLSRQVISASPANSAYVPQIRGRIIVDFKKFGSVRPSHHEYIVQSGSLKVDLSGEPIITDEEWCLFDSRVPGFSLSAKRWCFFELDRMTEFEYNTRAFESLALPDDQKAMLSSLVRVHTEELQFDDLVKGKGKGLIFLLHGEPGVGKTLTAGTYLLVFLQRNGRTHICIRDSK